MKYILSISLTKAPSIECYVMVVGMMNNNKY